MSSKLSNLLTYAFENVTYYKELFEKNNIDPKDINTRDDLEKLPLLTKSIVQSRHDDFISGEYQKYPKNENIVIMRTSGSTGKNLKVVWDQKDNIKSVVPLWVIRNKMYKINPAMKWCNFFSVMYSGNKIANMVDKEYQKNGTVLSFSKINLTYEKLIAVYNDMLEFQPAWLMLQPSVAYLLSEAVKNEKLPKIESLKYIELSGEYLFDNYRKSVEDAFDVPVVNLYGCNESNEIAIEYPDRKMHIISDNVIVEVIKNGKSVIGEEGDIYITSLNNYAMPFVRYETGDKGILTQNDKGDFILELKSGRSSDYIMLENNKKLNSYVVQNIMEYTNENMHSAIKQFQIVQNDYDKFTAYMVIDDRFSGWKKAVEEEFIENIADDDLKNTKWDFIWRDKIEPDPRTGKFKFFINSMKVSGNEK